MLNKKVEEAKKILNELKNIEENHNWSWFNEIYNKNKNNLSRTAILYRGKKITYREMFKKMEEFAKSMKALGISKQDEIAACVSNNPETIYLMGAASMIGAKVNLFNDDFKKNYLYNILNGCSKKILFTTDNMYQNFIDISKKIDFEKVYVASLTDSLPNGKDPYEKIDNKFYKFKNNLPELKKIDERIINTEEFLKIGKNYQGPIEEKVNLDDEFTITYSSGTTKSKNPKGIVHKVRAYITMGRFHNPKFTGTKSMENMIVLARILMQSSTNFQSNISDTFIQRATVALEPIRDLDFFPYALIINKPNLAVESKSTWTRAIKMFMTHPEFKNIKLPYLAVPVSVGEATSRGEEKYYNKAFRKLKAGTSYFKFPLSPATISIAGGDSEHGGIYINIFKALKDKNPKLLLKGETSGVQMHKMVEYAVLDDFGNILPKGKIGRLVANSPCNMKEYKNNKELTEQFFIKDKNGKIWGDMFVYAYIDNLNGVHILDRINEELTKEVSMQKILINDIITRDTKNILSCEVIPFIEDKKTKFVCHIEFQPDKKIIDSKDIFSIESRLRKYIDSEIIDNIVYRIRNFSESYPLTKCQKRDTNALTGEKFDRSIKPIIKNDEIICLSANEYFRKNNKNYTKKLTK